MERNSERAFYGAAALLFAASAVGTVIACHGMITPEGSAMTGMEMSGGWTMSMAWMRMPGQSWAGAAVAFIGMWILMMTAMMLPALVPMLRRYRRGVCAVGARRDRLTAVVGLGYLFVWTLLGAAAFAPGVALAGLAMRLPELARSVPIAAGAVVTMAGALQFTAWKSRQLAGCRYGPGRGAALAPNAVTAWRHGVELGIRCNFCCAGLTATLFVLGVMDLRAMAAVTAAIALERLAPAGEQAARAIGVVVVGAGLLLVARATGFS
jgi:predicted metal-binding membrane protein